MIYQPKQTGLSAATAGEMRLDMRGARVFALLAFSLLNVLYLLGAMQRTAIPGTFFSELQGDLGLLASQVTWAGALYSYCYASFQIFAGMLIDRFGGKNTAIVGGILLGAGLLLFASAHTAGQLYFARAVAALGQAFFYLCVVKISHLLFPPRQFGALVAISMGIGFAGGIAGTMPAQRLSVVIGWRNLFLAVGALSLAASACMALALRHLRERPRKSGRVTWRTCANLFNERGRFCFIVFNFFSYPAYFVLQAVLGQKFIEDRLGIPATAAANFTLLLTIGSTIFCVASAPLMRLVGDRRRPLVVFSCAVPVAVSLAMIAGIRLSAPAAWFLACFLAMSLVQINSTATSALLPELTDSSTVAFAAAVRNFFPYVGGGLVSAICGRILDAHAPAGSVSGAVVYPPEAYVHLLLVMFAFAAIGFLMSLAIPETRGRFRNGTQKR